MEPYFSTDLGYLIHGDAYEFMNSFVISGRHILLTDPMYGHDPNVKGEKSKRGIGRKLKGMRMRSIDWPDMDLKQFKPKLFWEFSQAIIWGANYFADRLPPSSKWLIWDKRRGRASDDNADCELAWTNLRGVSRLYSHLWRGVCREGEENISKQGGKLHPFQKPIGLMFFCLDQFETDSETIIIDPFTGSATIPAACECRKLNWIAIEKAEWCCEVASKRIEAEAKQLKLFN